MAEVSQRRYLRAQKYFAPPIKNRYNKENNKNTGISVSQDIKTRIRDIIKNSSEEDIILMLHFMSSLANEKINFPRDFSPAKLWADRAGDDARMSAVDFLRKYYSTVLDGSFTTADLKSKDEPLYRAIYGYISRGTFPTDINLPKRLSDHSSLKTLSPKDAERLYRHTARLAAALAPRN